MNFQSHTALSKKYLRQQLRQERSQLDLAEQQMASQLVCQQLAKLTQVQQAQQIFAYVALAGEIDLHHLFDYFSTKTWGIPRCVGQSLSWHSYQPEYLVRGAYGLWEPDQNADSLDAAATDLVLVPTLGCSQDGYRLGYGGGYYDRFLAQFPFLAMGVIGRVGWPIDFPVEPWDRPLQALVTPVGVQWFKVNP